MPEVRISLDEQDFRRLVAGRIVEIEIKFRDQPVWVQLGLKDIGFAAITAAVNDAMKGGAAKEPRPADKILEDEETKKED